VVGTGKTAVESDELKLGGGEGMRTGEEEKEMEFGWWHYC